MLIYILEDDDDIRELEAYALRNSNFEVEGFSCASEFYKSLGNALPDLILIDIMLPGENGLSVLKKLREKTATARIPVIMVTAKTTELDTVRGLDLGADDYICKPFGIMELVSRVKARLRRYTESDSASCSLDGIVLSNEQHTVIADGVKCELTYKEFELLKLLMSRPGKVYSRNYIMDTIWGYDYEGSSRTLDMHIKTLRQKLGNKGSMIKTIRNVGFKIESAEESLGKKDYT